MGKALTHEDGTSKTKKTVSSPRQNGVSKRSVTVRRRGFIRATPSPLVKSRSAIMAQHLKVMTPAQLLRCMNKTLLGTSKTPALPKSIIRNADNSSISSTKKGLLLSGPSPTTQATNATTGYGQDEQDCGGSEDTGSANRLMPPPLTSTAKFPKKYRSKLTSAGEASLNSNDGNGEKRSIPVGSRYDGRDTIEHASMQKDLEGTGSRLSSKREGAPSIAYKLPNLRE